VQQSSFAVCFTLAGWWRANMAESKQSTFQPLSSGRIVVVGTLLLGVTSLLEISRRARRRARRGAVQGIEVPMAGGWQPLLGHLFRLRHYVAGNASFAPARWALDVLNQEGLRVFCGEFLGMRMISVADTALVEEVSTGEPDRFTKDFLKFSPGGDLLLESFGRGLVFASTEDPEWQVAHRILRAPFSSRGVKAMGPLMCQQADELVRALRRDVGHGGVAYIDTWVTKMALETIAVCGLGTSLGCFESSETPPFVVSLNTLISCLMNLSRCPKWLRPLLMPFRVREFRRESRRLRQHCLDLIEKRAGSSAVGVRKDLLDVMLLDSDTKSGRKMTRDMVTDNVLTFLFAGQDSTAAAMASCLCYLCAHPACKAKLVEEIDEVVGKGALEWDHFARMPYLDSCIKETLRLVPPAPGFVRYPKGDQLLGKKWHIPDGVPVLVNIMAIHYDPKLWGEDAATFRPERWQEAPREKFAFIPFALGPRACTGREFSVLEQKVTLVKLLQQFDFERPPQVQQKPGCTTITSEQMKHPPFISMDVETKQDTAFQGLFSSLVLFERQQ